MIAFPTAVAAPAGASVSAASAGHGIRIGHDVCRAAVKPCFLLRPNPRLR